MNKQTARVFNFFFIAFTLFITIFSPVFMHGEELQKKTLLDVPFYPQQTYQCGPAAMASVVNYWGRPDSPEITPETIADKMFSKAARGSLTLDMYLYAAENDFETRQGATNVLEIKSRVDSGEPVIVLVDNGFWVVRRGHYLVVVGYSDSGFFVHDGYTKNTFVSFEDFEKRWSRTGHWALIMHPEKEHH